MNGYSLLEHTLRNILCFIYPLEEDWSMRFQLLHELRAVVESIEILRGATVEPYGSFVSNLFTRWGDLDISIELPNGSYISSPGKKLKLSLLGAVLKALRAKGGCRNLQFITNARVPILKFQGNYNISCDISINNLSGQMKSKILYWINMIDGRFRDMVLLTCVPAILPPLKEIYPGNMVDDLTGIRASAEKFIEETCAMNINQLISNKSRAINKSSVSQLFISFIAKFCDISSKASAQAISPFTGQWEDIESNMRWLPKTYTIFVEDPFEQPVNSARSVSSKQLTRIEEAFRRTHFMLISSNQNQNEVISIIVRPHVSKFMGTPRNQNNYSRNGLGPQVQARRAIKPPLQAQHQLQAQSYKATISSTASASGAESYTATTTSTTSVSGHGAIQPPVQAHQLQDKKVNRNLNSTQAIRDQTQPVWRPKSDIGV